MLWSPERETKENTEVRATSFLDGIFANDCDATCMFTIYCCGHCDTFS